MFLDINLYHTTVSLKMYLIKSYYVLLLMIIVNQSIREISIEV